MSSNQPGPSDTAPTSDAAEVRCDGSAGGRFRIWLLIAKVGIALIVVWALGRQIVDLVQAWSRQGPPLGSPVVAAAWIGLSGVLYLFGQLCFGLFWLKLLRQVGIEDSRLSILKAYAVGTLGKYVPGKALVVVMRTGLLRGGAGLRLPVALTSLYETVGMMAVGGGVAAVCFYVVCAERIAYWGGAAILAIGMSLVLHPIVFGRIAKFASMPLKGRVPVEMARRCYRVWLCWGVLQLVGWLCAGGSLVAVGRAVGIAGGYWEHGMLMTGAVGWATSVGFVVLLMPAGLGVRELLMTTVLAFRFPGPTATAAVLLLRIVWTGAELAWSGVFSVFVRAPRAKAGDDPVVLRADGKRPSVVE